MVPDPTLPDSRPVAMSTDGATTLMLRLARIQHGVVSRAQLVCAGVSATMVDARVRDSKLIPVLTGVYGLGHDVIGHRGWWWAALLSGGPGTVLSHATAAACWGLIYPRNLVEVLRRFNRERLRDNRESSPSQRPLFVHRSRCLPDTDLTVHEGFPVTSVARTILNCSAGATIAQIETMVSEADRLRILDWAQLEEVSRRGTGWRGVRKLRLVVESWDPRTSDAKSRMERRFLTFCRSHSIPAPLVNVMLGEFEVDCLWRDKRLVLELDSRGFHGDLKTFESDRRRDVVLGNAGYEVRRLTYRQLIQDPDYVLREVLSPFHRP